jgi:hypothetical protein
MYRKYNAPEVQYSGSTILRKYNTQSPSPYIRPRPPVNLPPLCLNIPLWAVRRFNPNIKLPTHTKQVKSF